MIIKEKLYIERDIHAPIFGDFWLRDVQAEWGRVRASHPGFVFRTTVYEGATRIDYRYKLNLQEACDMEGEFTYITDTEDIVIPYHFRFTDHTPPVPSVTGNREALTVEAFQRENFGEQFEEGSRERILWEAYVAKPVREEDVREFLIAIGVEKPQDQEAPPTETRVVLHDTRKQTYVRVQKALFEYLAERTDEEDVLKELEECIRILQEINEKEFHVKLLEYLWAEVADDTLRKQFVYQSLKEQADPEYGEFYAVYRYFEIMEEKDLSRSREVIRLLEQQAFESRSNLMFWLAHRIRALISRNSNELFVNLKRLISAGANSPFIYLEVLRSLERFGTALLRMDHVEVKVLHWAYRKHLLSDRILEYVIDNAESVATWQPALMEILSSEYEAKKRTDILRTICSLQIRGNRTDTQAFYRFRQGVDAGLEITGLVEYFLYSMPSTYYELLPLEVYIYFKANTKLTDRHRQILYANIIVNKENLGELYRSYESEMQTYALKALSERRINENLVILYNEFPVGLIMDRQLSHCMLNIYCAYRFHCEDPDVRKLTIVQKHLSELIEVWMADGEGEARVPDMNFYIIMEMADGRRVVSRQGEVEYFRIMNRNEDVEEAFKKGKHHFLALLENPEPDEEVYRELNQKKALRPFFRRRIQQALLSMYAADHSLHRHLEEFRPEFVQDKGLLVREYIHAGFYKQALLGLVRDGFSVIGEEDKEELLFRVLGEGSAVSDLIRDLALDLFYCGIESERLIRFLKKQHLLTLEEELEFYTVLQLKLPDDAAFSTKLDACCRHLLQEDDSFGQTKLYTVLWEYRDQLSEMQMLEMLRRFSVVDEISDENREWIKTRLENAVKEDIYPAWFLRFKEKGILPYALSDKVILTFPDAGYISYRYKNSKNRSFKDVPLKELPYGVYVAAVSMFYGDAIEYSLLDEKKRALTDLEVYRNEHIAQAGEYRDGYDRLNEIIYAKLNNAQDLNESVAEYKCLKDLAEAVFKPKV